MRILMVTPWFPTLANPVAGVFVARDAALLAEVHDVHVIHLVDPTLLADGEDISADHPFTLERVPWSRSSVRDTLSAGKRLRSSMADADVLHTHAFQALLPLAARKVTVPWVHSEHWSGIGDPDSLSQRGRAVLRATGGFLRRPDVVTAVSSHLSERIRTFRSGPIRIVPSVVSPVTALVAPPDDAHLIRLVAVGNLVDGKDPLLALATVQRLKEQGQEASLVWIGDGPLRSALESESAHSTALTLTGRQDAHGVARELDRADIFILPTRGETLCLAALEAIAHGRPVVIGSRGGQRDYISPENGRLVTDRTPDAYARAILDLWASKRSRTPESIAATIRDDYSPEAVLRGYTDAYREAVSIRGDSSR
ncbi:glycosyltransferase family 4 protein [Microbacterium paraoxydans]|uniref:glycosyltransferase family 4 protein n=1 Tax=Microbacterium paraoxydans TaxID=199592 RepID=UPI001CFC07D5|nr:glycosyltransferase family 4 protein [Microbacterium paraoxydans]